MPPRDTSETAPPANSGLARDRPADSGRLDPRGSSHGGTPSSPRRSRGPTTPARCGYRTRPPGDGSRSWAGKCDSPPARTGERPRWSPGRPPTRARSRPSSPIARFRHRLAAGNTRCHGHSAAARGNIRASASASHTRPRIGLVERLRPRQVRQVRQRRQLERHVRRSCSDYRVTGRRRLNRPGGDVGSVAGRGPDGTTVRFTPPRCDTRSPGSSPGGVARHAVPPTA